MRAPSNSTSPNVDDGVKTPTQIVAENIQSVNDVADNIELMGRVDANEADIKTVAASDADIRALGDISHHLSMLANDLSNIDAVAVELGSVMNVSNNMATLLLLQQRMALLLNIGSSLDNINAVALNEENIQSVVNHIPMLTTVVAHMDDIKYIGENSEDLTTIVNNLETIIRLGDNIDVITTVNENMDVILDSHQYVVTIEDTKVRIEAMEANVIALEASATAAEQSATASEANVTMMRNEVQANKDITDANAASTSADATQVANDTALVTQYRNEVQINKDATDVNAANTATDAAQTASDVVITNADVVSTNADAAQTAADRIATNADATKTDSDRVLVEGYRADVELDRAEVEANTAQVAADAAQVASNLQDTNTAKDLAERWAVGDTGSGVDTPSDTNNAYYFCVDAKNSATEARNNANQTFKSGGYFTPSAGQEYPDTLGLETDTIWLVKFNEGEGQSYTFVGGDLAGKTVKNGYMLVYDTPIDTFDFIPTTLSGASSVNGVYPDVNDNVNLTAANFNDIYSKTEVLAITDALTARIDGNDNDITVIYGDIAAIEADVVILTNRVTANETTLSNHTTQLDTNTTNIGNHATDISNLQTTSTDLTNRVNTNEGILANEVIKKSNGTTGGIEVPRWANDLARPDTSGYTKSVLGYNIMRKAYEAWNPETGKWGNVGGGLETVYPAAYPHTVEAGTFISVDVTGDISRVVTVPLTLNEDSEFAITLENWSGNKGVTARVDVDATQPWGHPEFDAGDSLAVGGNQTIYFKKINSKLTMVDEAGGTSDVIKRGETLVYDTPVSVGAISFLEEITEHKFDAVRIESYATSTLGFNNKSGATGVTLSVDTFLNSPVISILDRETGSNYIVLSLQQITGAGAVIHSSSSNWTGELRKIYGIRY